MAMPPLPLPSSRVGFLAGAVAIAAIALCLTPAVASAVDVRKGGANAGTKAGDDGSADDGPAGARDNVGGDVENLIGGNGADSRTACGDGADYEFSPRAHGA